MFLKNYEKIGNNFIICWNFSKKHKKSTNLMLTVEIKYDSMKDALLWCYMPN